MYVDASDYAVGGVLIQIAENNEQQIVAFVSKKFTTTARRWTTIEKEAYAMFYTVQRLQYYLFMKKFTLLTDHNNLVWMETSVVPKIVRMRIYLQSFTFDVVHVKGKDNVFADWLSRMYPEDQDPSQTIIQVCHIEDHVQHRDEVDTTIAKVHNSRMGHHGVQRTWMMLNKYFQGHGISIRIIQDFVSRCVWCQKVRNTLNQNLRAPIRAIVPEHPRHLCGYDTLYISPPDNEGFQYIHVFKLIPSRLVGLYPAKDLTAEGLAAVMYLFFMTYGMTDVLITDPGSNINSEVVKTLLQWTGIRLRMSIVGRHESCMVERSHRETLRFLSTLVNEERLKKIWSKPQVIATIQFIMNSEINRETSVSPYEYVFGSDDAKYFRLPVAVEDNDLPVKYLQNLNTNLQMIRAVAKKVQEDNQRQRLEEDVDAGANSYQIGDMVFVDEVELNNRKQKLISRYSGPYVVQKVHRADIVCKHIVTGRIREVHMQHVKPFFGSADEAYKAAMTDNDQYVIIEILNYKGDPERRSEMSFLVSFEDGDHVWIPFNQDLVTTEKFVVFCESKPELKPLLYTLGEWKRLKAEINAGGIQGVEPGMTCFVNLRAWGWDYFEQIGLPDTMERNYMVPCEYLKWTNSKKKKMDVRCDLFGQLFEWSAIDVDAYGRNLVLTDDMVLVNEALCQEHPKLLK